MNAQLAKPIPSDLVYSEMAVDERDFLAAMRAFGGNAATQN
jgi:hypothetical protein